jgi:hypothetical protein
MDDKCLLRIIANPYKLNKCKKKNNHTKNKDSLLYEYLEQKYKDIYIHHTLYYQVINSIDDIIIEYVCKNVINDMIMSICNKFD